jgi:hypothetical protein
MTWYGTDEEREELGFMGMKLGIHCYGDFETVMKSELITS